MRALFEIILFLAALVEILTYFNIEPNAIDALPERLREQANAAVKESDLELDTAAYSESSNVAYNIFQVAKIMATSYKKYAALEKSINAALDNSDLRLAVVAANFIENTYKKDRELVKIARYALKQPSNVGCAIIAADLAESDYTKDRILDDVVTILDGGRLSDLGCLSLQNLQL